MILSLKTRRPSIEDLTTSKEWCWTKLLRRSSLLFQSSLMSVASDPCEASSYISYLQEDGPSAEARGLLEKPTNNGSAFSDRYCERSKLSSFFGCVSRRSLCKRPEDTARLATNQRATRGASVRDKQFRESDGVTPERQLELALRNSRNQDALAVKLLAAHRWGDCVSIRFLGAVTEYESMSPGIKRYLRGRKVIALFLNPGAKYRLCVLDDFSLHTNNGNDKFSSCLPSRLSQYAFLRRTKALVVADLAANPVVHQFMRELKEASRSMSEYAIEDGDSQSY